ncbi:MAG: hypothetical protein ACI3ZZ_05805 [Candidatus Aphodosoma sp.]
MQDGEVVPKIKMVRHFGEVAAVRECLCEECSAAWTASSAQWGKKNE